MKSIDKLTADAAEAKTLEKIFTETVIATVKTINILMDVKIISIADSRSIKSIVNQSNKSINNVLKRCKRDLNALIGVVEPEAETETANNELTIIDTVKGGK